MADKAKDKPVKGHKHGEPIKQGDKFICPHCGAELPVNRPCPTCGLDIDWKRV